MENENKNPNEVELTAEKVIIFIVEVAIIISGIVAMFAAIWGSWTTFKVALSVFVGILAFVGVWNYLSETLCKLFKR